MNGALAQFAEKLRQADPHQVRSTAYMIQVALGAFFVIALLWVRNRESSSFFRPEEARTKVPPQPQPEQQARVSAKKPTLLLEGFKLNGQPHEILGVSPQATQKEIQKAYRNLMKRYHPDVVAPAGSARWREAQKIAEAINRAKDAMLGKG
jgi:DnaJ-domain-containing protein 1